MFCIIPPNLATTAWLAQVASQNEVASSHLACHRPPVCLLRPQLTEVVVLDGLGPAPELESLPYGYQKKVQAAVPALHERFVEQASRWGAGGLLVVGGGP